MDRKNTKRVKKGRIKFWLKCFLFIFISFHLAFFLSTFLQVVFLNFENPVYSSLMKLRNQYNMAGVAVPSFVPIEKIPSNLTRGVIYAEDIQFYRHPGFNPRAIFYAVQLNFKLGYTAYGGSTITQQIARTLFLNLDKNYIRKYMELLFALEMELFLSKKRILELYLNSIEWGPGIFGASDAAEYHFNKSLKELNDEELLGLISIMPNPRRFKVDSFKENKQLLARYSSVKRFFKIITEDPSRFSSTLKKVK